jgi:hypothetical protein
MSGVQIPSPVPLLKMAKSMLGDVVDNSFSWEHYTRLLRAAWLNPNNVAFQNAIKEYEREHEDFLHLLIIRWNILQNQSK